MARDLALSGFIPDENHDPAVAFFIETEDDKDQFFPLHKHRKGQLIMALHGGVSCEVEQGMWIVPPGYAVWIPGNMMHSNRVMARARLCFLFLEMGEIPMPEQCCTLQVSALVRALILSLAEKGLPRYERERTARLVAVLRDELPELPVAPLQLPSSGHPKICRMVRFMADNPGNRRTLSEWAKHLAMSERNLSRLILRETGMTWRNWRQQLMVIMAVRYLIAGQSVQVVSRTLGYESTTAFITIFRQVLGTTPGRYLGQQMGGPGKSA